MSASSKKKLRKEQNAAAMSERQLREQQEAKKLKRNTIIFVSVICVIVVAFLGLLVYNWIDNSGIIYKNTKAATVGDQTLSSTELNYFYNDAVQNTYSEWYETASSYAESLGMEESDVLSSLYGIDITVPLDEQQADENTTWADYFLNEALAEAQEVYAMVAAAEEEGFTLSEEDQTSLSYIESNLEVYAYIYGYSSTKAYLRAMYGSPASVDSYIAYQEKLLLADAYAEHYETHLDETTYDQSVIDAKDAEDTLAYNSYDYAYYYMSYEDFLGLETVFVEETEETETEEAETEETEVEETVAEETVAEETVDVDIVDEEAVDEEAVDEEITDEEEIEYTDEEKDAARATAKEVADKLAAAGSIEALDALISTLAFNADTDTASTKGEGVFYASVPSRLRDWISDSARTQGDVTVIANESTTDDTTVTNGYYVVYYTATNDNKTPMSNVRHLLVSFPENEDDSDPTDDQKADTLAQAEALLEEWKNGDATEDSFIELVKEHSEDGNAEDGGLYENINPGTSFVEPFLNWCLDADRQVGDVEIVETEYGYHIMYFSSYSDYTYRDELIMEDLRDAALESWRTAQLEKFPTKVLTTKHLTMDMVLG